MANAAAAEAAPAGGGKKKLIIIGAAVAVLLLGGGGAFMMMKKKPAEDGEDGEAPKAAAKVAAPAVPKHDPKAVPTFVPLDPFTVNLADRDVERYAQVGITLEVGDPKLGDVIKNYMPAIRNNILLALSDKTAAQLMDRQGKEKLAERVRRESSRAMGYDVEEPDEEEAEAEEGTKKKRRKRVEQVLPITAVHFSNFIIQ